MRSSSIQTKLLTMCIILVLFAIFGISANYYWLITQEKYRESQQRVQIAFDIILDDMNRQVERYETRLKEYLNLDFRLSWISNFYAQDPQQLGSLQFIVSSLSKAAEDLENFRALILADRLTLYTADRRMLLVSRRHDPQDILGANVLSATGQDTYLSMKDFSTVSSMLLDREPIPDVPLPTDMPASYEGELPDDFSSEFFTEGSRLGVKILMPIQYDQKRTGFLVGEIFYSQAEIEHYAKLSETEVNFFAGDQPGIGTFPLPLAPPDQADAPSCADIAARAARMPIDSKLFEDQKYYQGTCVLQNADAAIGTITVSLSQKAEQLAIQKILKSAFGVSVILIVFAFMFSVFFSHSTLEAVDDIVQSIGKAAEGDLRRSARAQGHDEIGMLATKLNQMIAQLRSISGQVQQASHSVSNTADTILTQMESLIDHMEHQSTSVDNTTTSVEKIQQFIETVATNTSELLLAAAQILSSIQEMRASIQEVTTSTGALTSDLYLISSAVDEVNQAIGQIASHSEELQEVVHHTEVEIDSIEASLQDVSQNADQTQQFAEETKNAALKGQSSVDASLQGMYALKTVVAQTAQLIQEVNRGSEQITSILDIVDNVTEQTSLLALNASIISAQAGTHGRGFAVVADEIKQLATRTKTSTSEIGTLIRELQHRTQESVQNTMEGLQKADEGMALANAVKDSLHSILDSATRSSNRATDTAQVVQHSAASSQIIKTQMTSVKEMVVHIREAIQKERQDLEQVGAAVENISGMSEQVNHANIEQKSTVDQIADSMTHVTEKFDAISDQTEELRENSQQIVMAMHTIETTTENILGDASSISNETVTNLIAQAELLQNIVKIFKVS